jgi:uncharacterized membrane protein
MEWKRFFRHLFATRAALHRAFPDAALSAIDLAITDSERWHTGEIRVAIEASLEPLEALRGRGPRDRALQVFSGLGVWDTDANNGVLVYLLLADNVVEIVADRGYNGLVAPADWAGICHAMEVNFRAGRFEQGMLDGIGRVGGLLAAHFPGVPGSRNPDELPNRPAIL